MKINKILLERIVHEEIRTMYKEYVLLERTIKRHQRTLDEKFFQGLQRGFRKFFGGGATPDDLEAPEQEKATAARVADTDVFMKKIKELDTYNTNLSKLLKSDPGTINKIKSQLNDYVQTFKEAMDLWKESPPDTQEARAGVLESEFKQLRYILSSYLFLITDASRRLNSLTRSTKFAQKMMIQQNQTTAPKPSSSDRGVGTGRSPISTTATGGIGGVTRLESKRRKG